MSNTTPNLNLFKWDPIADKKSTFNIDTCMNENWDKLDIDSKNKADVLNLLNQNKANTNNMNNFSVFQKFNFWGTLSANSRGICLISSNMYTGFDSVDDTKYKASNDHPEGASGVILDMYEDDIYMLRQKGAVTANQELNPEKIKILTQKNCKVFTSYTLTLLNGLSGTGIMNVYTDGWAFININAAYTTSITAGTQISTSPINLVNNQYMTAFDTANAYSFNCIANNNNGLYVGNGIKTSTRNFLISTWLKVV